MKFFDLKNISERNMDLVDPTSPEKVLKIGRMAGLHEGGRVIDFGCGFGEVLALWAVHFGIRGEGIDIREEACVRARRKVASRGLEDRITIVCANGAEYKFEEGTFDVAACIGATFIWKGGFSEALQNLKRAIRPGGKLIVGEAHWLTSQVPIEYSRTQDFRTEYELLQMLRAEGLDLEYVVRAARDDWDRYEADNWQGLVQWIQENPDHPERAEVIAHLRETQDEYFMYERDYVGWAMYLLTESATG